MPSITQTLQSSITHSQSKMRLYCSVQRIMTNTNHLTASIKACNHTLLDFLHLSRNRYVYFCSSRASTFSV